MARIIYPMTAKQLVGYVKCYEPHFPDWQLVRNQFFLRTNGPVAQVVGFEALRSGAYRPSSGIRILVAPDAAMLHQFLDIKHRDVLPRQHEAAFPGMLAAMDEQFVPAIRLPLDPPEVYDLCEAEALRRIVDAYALAALHAYLGNREQAVFWLDLLEELAVVRNEDLPEWERDQIAFGRLLRKHFDSGDVKAFLDDVLLNEERRLRGKK